MQPLSIAAERPLVALGGVLTLLLLPANLVALGYWVYHDARARGSDAAVWWVFAAVPTGLGLLAYLWARRRFGPRERPPTPRERLAAAWTIAAVAAFVVSAVLAPPDPFAQALAYPPLFAVALAASSLLLYRRGGTGGPTDPQA